MEQPSAPLTSLPEPPQVTLHDIVPTVVHQGDNHVMYPLPSLTTMYPDQPEPNNSSDGKRETDLKEEDAKSKKSEKKTKKEKKEKPDFHQIYRKTKKSAIHRRVSETLESLYPENPASLLRSYLHHSKRGQEINREMNLIEEKSSKSFPALIESMKRELAERKNSREVEELFIKLLCSSGYTREDVRQSLGIKKLGWKRWKKFRSQTGKKKGSQPPVVDTEDTHNGDGLIEDDLTDQRSDLQEKGFTHEQPYPHDQYTQEQPYPQDQQFPSDRSYPQDQYSQRPYPQQDQQFPPDRSYPQDRIYVPDRTYSQEPNQYSQEPNQYPQDRPYPPEQHYPQERRYTQEQFPQERVYPQDQLPQERGYPQNQIPQERGYPQDQQYSSIQH